jgi:2-dehydropantoate 2-reductase
MTWGHEPLRVAVVGAGGVGAFLGSRLAAAGADVSYLARGAHLAALVERGLTIVGPDGASVTTPVRATANEREIGPVDTVVFTVKSYDTDAAAERLPPLVGDGTAVLSLQNGIDNEDRIAAVVGREHVLGGAAYVQASIQGPGVVRSGPSRIVVGELDPGPASERVRRIAEVATAAGVRASAVDDVRLAKWEKYVLLVAFSAVSAATQLPLGDIRRSAAAVAMLRAIAEEAWAVGRAQGVPQADDEGTSLRHDLLHGRRMEIAALQGALSRLGRETGVATPWTDAAYAILEPWAIHNERLTTQGADPANGDQP